MKSCTSLLIYENENRVRNTKKSATYWQQQGRSIACFSVDLSRNLNIQKITPPLFIFINSLINYSHGKQITVFQFQIISVNFLPLSLLFLSQTYMKLQTLKYATAGQLKINGRSVQLLPRRSQICMFDMARCPLSHLSWLVTS